jgi:uncharacterized protein (DUF433 family)
MHDLGRVENDPELQICSYILQICSYSFWPDCRSKLQFCSYSWLLLRISRLAYTFGVPPTMPELAPGQDKRSLGRYSIPEAASSLAMPVRTMRSWFLGEKAIFTPSYHKGSTVFLSFNDLTEAYVIEVLRTHYEFHPVRIRAALLELRRKTKLEKPLAQRELYAIPEFQNLVDVRRHKGRTEYVDLAHNQNLVFDSFVTSLGKRIQRDGRGRVTRIYPWNEANSDDSPLSMDPDVLSGELVISGTRLPAQLIVAKRVAGRTAEEIAALYNLSTELVMRVLSYFERRTPQKASA